MSSNTVNEILCAPFIDNILIPSVLEAIESRFSNHVYCWQDPDKIRKEVTTELVASLSYPNIGGAQLYRVWYSGKYVCLVTLEGKHYSNKEVFIIDIEYTKKMCSYLYECTLSDYSTIFKLDDKITMPGFDWTNTATLGKAT